MEKENNKLTINEREDNTLKFWEESKILEKTLKKTKDNKPFVFYDGPPFATGTPHYGHLLTSFMKDVIPRYRTMKGNHVRRVWGWDCHGLPLENIIEKELGLEHKKDIEKFGIEKFNETARGSVMRYDADWKKLIPRIGRWVDMENSYKTMDAKYSESIWWAFKTLFDKKLVYKGFKSMHICPRCETTLSNNEVAEGYKDITDISVTVKFELIDEPGTYVLAWTTTPWTLPGNVALSIGEDVKYVKAVIFNVNEQEAVEGSKSKIGKSVLDTAKQVKYFTIIASKSFVEKLDSQKWHIESQKDINSKDLVGKEYKPLFDYYQGPTFKNSQGRTLGNYSNGWKIYPASFVTTESGTGVVHIAPAFGDDDLKLSEKYNLPFIQHVGMDGTFAKEVADFAGMQVKPKDDHQRADIEILKYLAHNGLLFSKEKIIHSYPHCWRCETPLLNYATSSWFVKVTALKKKLTAENNKIEWVPKSMKHGRFGKWLTGARDWAISRTRFWGAPLPVWECSECKKMRIVGSLKELLNHTESSENNYFIMRHAQAENNVLEVIGNDPRNASKLTDLGKMQAKKTGESLKKKKINLIYSSDFTRARETAEIVAKEIGISQSKIMYDPRLREVNTGVFENKTNKEYNGYFSSTFERFYKTPERGENLKDVKRRIMEFIIEINKNFKNKNVLIVGHDHALWTLVAGSLGFTNEQASKMKLEGINYLKNAQTMSLSFKPFPHNKDYELDFHRPYIDNVKLKCECGNSMSRIPDVFDCWFESGSMPYAQFHYPFENQKEFKKNFPADFIGEGLDQTRGWFYSMLVLSTGLFGKTPFKNVIVNGLVLAEDGQKMSKRLNNYPDPESVVQKFGADALRYYMLSSPIVHGEDLRFSEKGIDEVQKKVIGRLLNVLSFYELYADKKILGSYSSKHILDQWILARLNETIIKIGSSLDEYTLDNATRPIGDFVEDLSTWYLRRSRDRFKDADQDRKDKKDALATLRHVLLEFSKIIAPTLPFLAEEIYQKVKDNKGKESVHLETWPKINKQLSAHNRQLILWMQEARQVASLGLEARAKALIKVRQPLQLLKIKNSKLKSKNELLELIKDELNIKSIQFDSKIAGSVKLDTSITQELKKEGQYRELIRNIQELRKQEGFTPKDKVIMEVDANNRGEALIEDFTDDIKRICILKEIKFTKNDKREAIDIDDLSFKLKLLK